MLNDLYFLLVYFFLSYVKKHVKRLLKFECACVSETDMFYLAISMVGTDFSMIAQLLTHRSRAEIKVHTP